MYGDDNLSEWSNLFRTDHLSGDAHVHRIDDLWWNDVCGERHLSG